MKHYDVPAIIDRAKAAMEITQDQQLAKRLGISRTTIASWKRRKSIPAKYLSSMILHAGVTFDWLITGKGEPSDTDEIGMTNKLPYIDEYILWLALLSWRVDLAMSKNKLNQNLADQLDNSMLATGHIFLGNHITQLMAAKEKWENSGLVSEGDIYKAIATEYGLNVDFDKPTPLVGR